MNTQDARTAYADPIGGFYQSGANYGKPYLAPGWDWARVTFLAGGYPSEQISLAVHPAVRPAMLALASVFHAHGYAFRETAGGTVSMRNITGASNAAITEQVRLQTPLATSIHAHGAALDINPSQNPYGPGYDELEEGPWSHVLDDARRIRQVDGLEVFRCGADWSNDDAMHFEATACTRPQLERGIDVSTVVGWSSYVSWAGLEDEMFAEFVLDLQKDLNKLGFTDRDGNPLEETSEWNNKTRQAHRRMMRAAARVNGAKKTEIEILAPPIDD